MITRCPEPRTLRTLNRVLAGWLGSDPATADDLNAALALMEIEDAPVAPAPWDTQRLGDAARHLLKLHAPTRRFGGAELGLVDFRGEPFDPLFARVSAFWMRSPASARKPSRSSGSPACARPSCPTPAGAPRAPSPDTSPPRP